MMDYNQDPKLEFQIIEFSGMEAQNELQQKENLGLYICSLDIYIYIYGSGDETD